MIAASSNGSSLGWSPLDAILNLFKPDAPAPAPVAPPPPPKTGWEAWSATTKVAVVGGGAAVLGLIAFLALRR